MNPQDGRASLRFLTHSAFLPALAFFLAITPKLVAHPGAQAAQAVSPEGEDFSAEAALLYRVVACSGNAALPANLNPQIVAKHCALLKPRMERYRRRYLARARPFIAGILPHPIPDNVVYPFGGGDLLSALTTYPDLRKVTTLSLELAGDPRRITTLDDKRLEDSLDFIDRNINSLLAANESTSKTLEATQQGDLPGQLCFFLVGLAVHGYEPVSLRYFRMEPDGSLHYYAAEEVHTLESGLAQRRHGQWTPPDFSEAFANSELVFRPLGSDGPLLIHRHIAANLRDDYLKKRSPVLLYLESQGRVSAMTKAGSYCLWNPLFSRVRNYLLANMEVMISDSSGIPPELARQAGFVQDTYGSFEGAMCFDSCPDDQYSDQFRDLWAGQPHRALAFRYGYVDAKKSYHLMVTRRAPQATP